MSRARFDTYEIVNESAKTSSFNSDSVEIETVSGYSLQADWTETSISGASIAIGASNDNTTFYEVTGSSQTISSDSGYMWNMIDQHYRYFRIQVTIGGGTLDTLVVTLHIKDS